MSKAFIGDVHGCYQELEELWWKLRGMGIAPEDIYHAGDLPDRGPDSHLAIKTCRELGIKGVMGNHDYVIIDHWKSMQRQGGKIPTKSPDKARTLKTINQKDVDYMAGLPFLHIFDDIKTILVHGGLLPQLEFWQQPPQLICRLQLIHPNQFGWRTGMSTRWFNKDRKGVTEADYAKAGWVRWSRVWDHEYNVVYGHSGFRVPRIEQMGNFGKTIGIDTRCCFGGSLTAVIMPEMEFVSVPAKKIWHPSDPAYDKFVEENGD